SLAEPDLSVGLAPAVVDRDLFTLPDRARGGPVDDLLADLRLSVGVGMARVVVQRALPQRDRHAALAPLEHMVSEHGLAERAPVGRVDDDHRRPLDELSGAVGARSEDAAPFARNVTDLVGHATSSSTLWNCRRLCGPS